MAADPTPQITSWRNGNYTATCVRSFEGKQCDWVTCIGEHFWWTVGERCNQSPVSCCVEFRFIDLFIFALIKVFSLHACYNLKCSCMHRKRPLPFFLACRTLRVFPLKVIMDAVHVENCVVCSVTFQTDDMLQMEHAYLKVRCKYISGLGLILKNTNTQTNKQTSTVLSLRQWGLYKVLNVLLDPNWVTQWSHLPERAADNCIMHT